MEKQISKPNKQYSQPTLDFLRTTDGTNSLVLRTTRVQIENHPKWVELLLSHFNLVAVNSSIQPPRYTLQCLMCDPKNLKRGASDKITDKGSSSFIRHMKIFHPEAHDNYLKTRPGQVAETESNSSPKIYTAKGFYPEPYKRSDPKQKLFEKDLLNFIILDSQPCQIVEGIGFKQLVHRQDPKLIIPHRNTVARWIHGDFEKVQQKIKDEIQAAPLETLHFVIDLWTSLQRQSIMGINVQFIQDWKLKQYLVGFKHFPQAHTSDNIKEFLRCFFADELKIKPSQVGTVTADNAANILGAFKQDFDYGKFFDSVLSSKCLEEDSDFINEGQEELTDFSLLESWSLSVLNRNGCLAHLLHLTVKDSVSSCQLTSNLQQKVNDIVSFFNSSPKWTEELRERTKNIGLVKPCPTRWNGFYYALLRLTKSDKVNIAECINDVLKLARTSKRVKVPALLTESDQENIRLLVQLLEPLSDLSAKIQGNSVTSSIVLLGIINALKSIKEVEVAEHELNSEEITAFRGNLTKNILDRFASVSPSTGLGRKVSVNIFRVRHYVLASLLDPRIKTKCFDRNVLSEVGLIERSFSKEQSINELNIVFKKEKDVVENKLPESDGNISEDKVEHPPQKKSKSMFNIISNVESQDEHLPVDEIDSYLKTNFLIKGDPEKYCPLNFWKENEFKYPLLSKLARKYLAMPASSASIERIFSVTSSFGKTMNARISPETVEHYLCCRFYRLMNEN